MAEHTKTQGRSAKKPTRKLVAVSAGSSKSASQDAIENVRAEAPRPLSPKEKGVLEFLETYMRGKGVSPTYQEICQHFGFASFNSVQRYLKQLEDKGYIQLPWANQKRAITLLHRSTAVQDSLQTHDDGNSENSSDHSEFSNVTRAIMPAESLSLPLLGRVAAGAPIEAMEDDEFIDVPASLVRNPDTTFALRVQGQSMIDDGIFDGDVILVQRQSSASDGEIVVAVINEEATVKRFYKNKAEKMIELRPANSTMSPMWFEPHEVQLRGVVVGLIRRFF
jgi:repressor LexA